MGAERKRISKITGGKAWPNCRIILSVLMRAIFMHPTILKASGHVDNFNDRWSITKTTRKDTGWIIWLKGMPKNWKAKGTDGCRRRSFTGLPMDSLLAKDDFAGLKKTRSRIIKSNAVSETCNWTDIRQFNLMFLHRLIHGFSDAEDNKFISTRNGAGHFR